MRRRRFLQLASRAGAGIAVGGPLLGPAVSEALGRDPATGLLQGAIPAGSSVDPVRVVLLDGGWSIARDPDNAGRTQGWFKAMRPDAKAVRCPSIIQEVYPEYHGVVWYWTRFASEPHPYVAGVTLLRFGAVDYLADVWVNGTYLGSHEGGDLPFTLDATAAVVPGNEGNLLAVRVLNPTDQPIDGIVLVETPHRNKFMKMGNGSLPDFGGILAPVELLYCPAVRIHDVFLRPDWKTGEVRIETAVHNIQKQAAHVRVRFNVSRQGGSQVILTHEQTALAKPGESSVSTDLLLKDHQLWSFEDPCLYRMDVRVEASGVDGAHETSARFGFRDFRVTRGYFRLNGRRIFLKCTHTGNHVPFGQVVPPPGAKDLLRKDLLYAKASGFNTVRFISGVAYPYELDMCDELGLMVYEESSGSWLLKDVSNVLAYEGSPSDWHLKDSSVMKTRYERSVREMILRDRNHPCVTMWGMLNETEDGTVFQEAVSALSMVRGIDDTRLILLSSGRFDGNISVGSVSNPQSSQWEYEWGKEEPGAAKVPITYPSGIGVGDFHLYPTVPQTPEIDHLMRTLGEGGKPVFLSEYGIGSMMNVIQEARWYEQLGIPEDTEDFVQMRSMADRFSADWKRLGMEVVYPFAETLLQRSQMSMARHRLLGFNLIRSNPKICGFNLTGMLDHALTGEGLWRFWRDWKPGAFDAVRDGWAPVRWCLFVEPTHTYADRPVRLEAVLANEDAVRPGEYPAEIRVWGPRGAVWSRQASISIPQVTAGQDGPLAVPVVKETVTLNAPAGTYQLVPSIGKGIAAPETSWQFHISDRNFLPQISGQVLTWGIPANVEAWLKSRGVKTAALEAASTRERHVVLIGNVSGMTDGPANWKQVATLLATGSTAVFLSPKAFGRGNGSAALLPLSKKGTVQAFHDWLYHKECVAKDHPVFAGLQAGGVIDWYYYGPTLPTCLFAGQDTPAEVIAAAFAAGYSTPGGYASGVLMGSYAFGQGRFVVNSFQILEHVDVHPVADRLLLNLIVYAKQHATGPAAALPSDFDGVLRGIGYIT